MFVIRPVGFDLDPEKVPETITTFQELLLFFDKHDLYGKRYSFETFEITEPQYIIFPNYLTIPSPENSGFYECRPKFLRKTRKTLYHISEV